MQIASDRDRVPRARRPRSRRGRAEWWLARNSIQPTGRTRTRTKKRKKGSQEPRSNESVHHQEKEHTAKKETTRPIVIAIPKGRMFLQCVPTRNQTQTTLILPFVSLVPATKQQVAQPSTCPSCLPATIHIQHRHPVFPFVELNRTRVLR